jgi:hypothetical protein
MIAIASSSRLPITTRSGRMKSLIAAPSRRNSGFETTPKLARVFFRAFISSRRCSPVPMGTVDLVTITL